MRFFFAYAIWVFFKVSRLVGAFLFSSIVTMLLKFIFFFISFCFDHLLFRFIPHIRFRHRKALQLATLPFNVLFLTETWYGVYCHVTVAVRQRSIIRAQHRLFHYLLRCLTQHIDILLVYGMFYKFLEGSRSSFDL